MKKILKNVLLFSALIGSVNCLALPAAAVDVATANTSVTVSYTHLTLPTIA